MRLLLLLLLAGCAGQPLTVAEQLRAEQREQERREAFLQWVEWCQENGILFVNRALSCDSLRDVERGCIPHPAEWKIRESVDKRGNTRITVISNTYSCIERGGLRF